MAAPYTPINTQSPKGGHLKGCLDQLRAAITGLTQDRAQAAAMVDPADPGNFSMVETQFGLPTGTGATVAAKLAAVQPLSSNVALLDLITNVG